MTTVSLRFDDNTKKELDEMCAEMGMNLTTFFYDLRKKALRERKNSVYGRCSFKD